MTNDAQEKMLNLARKFKTPLENIRFEVRHGNIRDEVNNAVEAHNAEMIIIGSRKPGIATHLLGSAAANIFAIRENSSDGHSLICHARWRFAYRADKIPLP
ncbi:universal stress protein g [Citrobacter koseri]|uniref:Universal stress protein g n=1 Tax=Citrobacter koseri TaxID=545 RepID=A0A3S4IBB3_CITKO|nr:universal stress protein g [Citrobacter koseri]